ncbi:hypothetical protein X777_05706 [Ooceraea biroi]|uniref:DUF7041 domain-containing protein n=1 Tax=Ooceraea biroi TaxID=2015173 RepID=A0A026WEP3_OOCBI|nr:hypothetical protein X777_05706 [Ooceraea biroi]
MTFALHRITSDESKFRYVVIHLDADLLGIVGDIIESPPVSGKYDALKKRIIDSLSESQETRLRRLLRGQALGDDKPSVFLQRMRNLSGGQCNDSVLRTLFMEQMPEHVRGILAVCQLDGLPTLAAQADRIAEVMKPQVSSVIAANKSVHDLCCAVEALTERFDRAFRGRSQSRARRYNRSRSNTPHKETDRNKLCFYHKKFGTKAENCRQPCSWVDRSEKPSEN